MQVQSDSPLILAVDDQPENLMILEVDLQDAGYRVDLAEGGRVALEKIAAQLPDLMLLDISMPGLDGIRICQTLRIDPKTKDLPIIMVTGRDSTEDIVAGLDVGANDYVTKPIEVEVLLARIRTQLRLKNLQDQLRNTIEELEELQQIRADFVAMITHDMKAPLTSIIGVSSMLKDGILGDCPSSQFRDALNNVYENSHQLTRLINDFLTFSRIEAGKLEILSEPVDLNLSILQTISLQIYSADQKKIRIDYHSIENLPHTLGDSSQIERAIGNVLTNAIKYSPEGKTVAIRLQEKNDWLILEIEDQGPGIPKELLPKLFERYFRVRSPKNIEGTGLGLSIVKSIVEAHGGKVEVQTETGKGSCFTLEFPVLKEKEG